jgi:hypothetical protein
MSIAMDIQPYHILYNVKTEWILHLSGEDDEFLDNSGSLVLQELLNDEITEGTGPNDGEFLVSSHKLTLFVVYVILRPIISIFFETPWTFISATSPCLSLPSRGGGF